VHYRKIITRRRNKPFWEEAGARCHLSASKVFLGKPPGGTCICVEGKPGIELGINGFIGAPRTFLIISLQLIFIAVTSFIAFYYAFQLCTSSIYAFLLVSLLMKE
jgi:hypothetical protein